MPREINSLQCMGMKGKSFHCFGLPWEQGWAFSAICLLTKNNNNQSLPALNGAHYAAILGSVRPNPGGTCAGLPRGHALASRQYNPPPLRVERLIEFGDKAPLPSQSLALKLWS